MKCLVIIDMQEDYVGDRRNNKRYPYDAAALIGKINERIREYPTENIIYVLNRFFWEPDKTPKSIVQGLPAVSSNIFYKRKTNSFSNKNLLNCLQELQAKEIEVVGVDGNYCVRDTALGGIKHGLKVKLNENCVGTANLNKYKRTKKALAKQGVEFIF